MFRDDIGNVLERARYEAGWSRPKLAEASGINEDTIFKIEKGVHIPRGQTVVALLRALGLDPDDYIAAGAAS